MTKKADAIEAKKEATGMWGTHNLRLVEGTTNEVSSAGKIRVAAVNQNQKDESNAEQVEKEHDIKVSKEDKKAIKAAFEQVDADGSSDIDLSQTDPKGKAEHEKLNLNKNKNIKEHTMVCSSVDVGYRFKVFMFQNIVNDR